jgi:molecular chaperone GrpE
MVDETRPTDPSQSSPDMAGETPGSTDGLQEENAVVDTEVVSVGESVQDGASTSTDGSTASDQGTTASDSDAQISSLKAQLDERTGQYMRIAADFENYRRRSSKEREEQEVQIKRGTITELLPVIDNFERARAQIKPQTESEMTIHKSYQSVYKQLVDCLKRLGVSAMRAEGQEFDPNLHEAVMREPTSEHPEGTVMEELVRGYMIGDRVLRHAMVKVAAAPEPGTEADSPATSD